MTPEQIKTRMRARGFKQVDLANLLNVEPTKVSKSLSGVRAFKPHELDLIRDWLREEGEVHASDFRSIPIIGQVAASNWGEAVRQSTSAMPAPDATVPARAFALEVAGDSMDLFVEDGGKVIVDPDDKALFPGRFYVISNGQNETTFKRFAADPARLVPCSTNPDHREILLGSGESFVVVGRVIWRASRM